MDEDFKYFLDTLGPTTDKRHVPPSSIDRYRGKLPDQLLAYWQEHGWSGYADGLFWTVNPQEYQSVLEAWIGQTPFVEQDTYHLIARSAFGTLYFLGEKHGFTLKISAVGSYATPQYPSSALSLDTLAQRFFSYRDREESDFADLFTPALKKLGRLAPNEMFGFIPALALGGPATLEHLQKVKTVEHLVFLAQLSELRVMDSSSP
ncbi:MAG: DUF1851 domain-containing protein [Rhodocyclales bacterium GT-UBC]|nr:MAG: DUF1851 domain-containing protein [Rhodocyclales bacterium GT-UBC]